ncbi:MAG TPA: YdcF family protein [Bryobacteraceae bacterium]|nr:YdcF family protein [Bryobacteraceae bacterium]
MLFYLGKIASYLMAPVSVSLILLLLAFVFYRRSWLGRGLLFLGIVTLWAFSTRRVSQALMYSLEYQVPGYTIETAPHADAMVVLGGLLHSPTPAHKESELEESSDRLLEAVRLYKAGKAPLIIVTGGTVTILEGKDVMNESQAARQVLIEWGVPDAAIVLETQSQNTHENATETRKILDGRGIHRVLLITSAFHMPRAVPVFQKAGIEVVPCPTDFRTGWGEPDPVFRYLPDPIALEDSSEVVKERLGLLIYRLHGWA